MNDATAEGVTTSILSARELRKQFRQGDVTLNVLNGVNLMVGRGERVAIIGVSGSGKTTLLQLLGGLDLPTGGSVSIQAGCWLPQISVCILNGKPLARATLYAASKSPQVMTSRVASTA